MRNWSDLELETWIVEAGGDVVEKKSAGGLAVLTPLDRLIYCLWVADYGMRNAGDLVAASEMHATFQQEAASLALKLGLKHTHAAFSMPTKILESLYFELLSDIVVELDAKRIAGGH